MYKKIGFTGTRFGMSELQKKEVKKELLKHMPDEVHHGMCKGADIDFHNLVREYCPDCVIHGHRGYSAKDGSSYCEYVKVDVNHDESTYFARNRDIVNQSEYMIGTPYNTTKKGGTWYTIEYAQKQNKPTYIIYR